MFEHDENNDLARGATVFVVAVVVLLLCGFGAYLVDAWANQHIYQSVTRQNLNHDADWLRAKTGEVTNLYHDFQDAQTAETADVTQLHQYVKDHGEPSSWPSYSATAQVYQQMMNKYMGDYQAEVTDAQQYNADRDNPDYAPVWAQSALAAFPETLDAGPQPQL